MNKKLSLTIIIIAVLALVSSAAVAMAPLGTPTADLKAGQFGVGIEYAYNSTKIKIEDSGTRLKTNMLLANLGYGVMDDWKGFLRLGIGNARAEDFAGDYQFAIGWGTKYTFLKQENLDWGALFQMNWLRSDDEIYDIETEMKPYDIVLAVGPTYKYSEDISFYGGPLLQFVRGTATAEFEGEEEEGSIREKNAFGAYVGTQVVVCANAALFGEFMFVGNGWGLATGVNWKF